MLSALKWNELKMMIWKGADTEEEEVRWRRGDGQHLALACNVTFDEFESYNYEANLCIECSNDHQKILCLFDSSLFCDYCKLST